MRTEIAADEVQMDTTGDADSAVDIAMEVVRQLTELARDGEEQGVARQIFDLLNARLFLGFQPVKVKKRTLNKTKGGVVTFGDDPPPIRLYKGRTAWKGVKNPAASAAVGWDERGEPSPPDSRIGSGREGNSLRNISRGDWI